MKTHSEAAPASAWGGELNVLRQARAAVRMPEGGWLRAVRAMQGIPQRALAEKIGIQRQAWAQFEDSEARGAISLYSLRRAAEALDCEVVYFLTPKDSAAAGAVGTEHHLAGEGPVGGVARGERVERTTVDAAGAQLGNWFAEELPTELR